MKTPIIFDLDGVIVDSETHWRRVSHEFLQGLIPAWSESDQRAILGLSATDVFTKLTTVYGAALSWEEYLESYQRLAATIYGELATPVDGVLELLAFLSQAGYPLGLASSAPRAWVELVLNRFFLNDRFLAAVSADDVGTRTKPDPEPYLQAARLLGRPPAECVAIEDSPKGVKSAKAAGMRCVALALPHTRERDLSQADCLITSFHDIPVRTFESWLKTSLALPKT